MLDIPLLLQAIVAVSAGYLFGSLPFAHFAGRTKGVDIFKTGSTLAGTANVYWNVGHRTGALVFVGDLAKGAAAGLLAWALDMPPALMLVAGAAAVAGHWMSVFTSFRGGDGMAPLMGVSLALVPPLAAVGAGVGVITIVLLRRSELRSTWGVCACFLVILAGSQYFQMDRDLVYGLTTLAVLVLLRSLLSRRRRHPVGPGLPASPATLAPIPGAHLEQHLPPTPGPGPGPGLDG